MSCRIHNNAKYEGLDELAKNLYNFANKKFSFSKPVTIVFESSMENVGKVFAPTGHYDPRTKKIIVFVDHRHPKDILRSLAHELVHHKQNCDGHFDGTVSTDPGYAQRDQHMREMEGDAYRTGNVMLFRDWEDNYKKGKNVMEEGKKKTKEELASAAGDPDKVEKEDFEAAFGKKKKEGKKPDHKCANHVKENRTGREGRAINHTLFEDGLITHYTVEFQNEIVENIPVNELTALSESEHDNESAHEMQREDYDHDKTKPRRDYTEEKTSDKEWYQGQLNEALMKKFKIIK
jgi:hypothetical protein